jgi:hypothetical protein
MLLATATATVELAGDRLGDARAALDEARAWLPPGRFQIQHYYVFIAELFADMYAGDPAAALARLEGTWPALGRSLLLRMQNVRAYSVATRARARLAVAAQAPARRKALLAGVASDVRQLRGEGHSCATADALVLNAMLDAYRGDRERAIEQLARAAAAFDAMPMHLHAASLRLRLGALVGGAEGRARTLAAEAELRARGVRDVERFARALVPEVPSHSAGAGA